MAPGTKATTDAYLRLEVQRFAREGVLGPGYWGGWQWTCDGKIVARIHVRGETDHVILTYWHRSGSGNWAEESYPVPIVRTPCHLGGSRPWFVCPGVGCGRRVAILYGGAIFACRHCHQLAYPSTREDAGDRASRRADRISARLGWEPGILTGDKPKWMRWRTFDRLTREHHQFVARSMSAIEVKLNRLITCSKRLGDIH